MLCNQVNLNKLFKKAFIPPIMIPTQKNEVTQKKQDNEVETVTNKPLLSYLKAHSRLSSNLQVYYLVHILSWKKKRIDKAKDLRRKP